MQDTVSLNAKRSKAYDIVLRLGRADGIAVIGMLYGQILTAGGESAEALTVLRRSAEMFRKLGQESSAQEVDAFVGKLGLE